MNRYNIQDLFKILGGCEWKKDRLAMISDYFELGDGHRGIHCELFSLLLYKRNFLQ